MAGVRHIADLQLARQQADQGSTPMSSWLIPCLSCAERDMTVAVAATGTLTWNNGDAYTITCANGGRVSSGTVQTTSTPGTGMTSSSVVVQCTAPTPLTASQTCQTWNGSGQAACTAAAGCQWYPAWTKGGLPPSYRPSVTSPACRITRPLVQRRLHQRLAAASPTALASGQPLVQRSGLLGDARA